MLAVRITIYPSFDSDTNRPTAYRANSGDILLSSDITISFSPDSICRFTVERSKVELIDKASAMEWFSQQFDALGCKAQNPTGKILMRNVVINVAKSAGAPRFNSDRPWAELFVQNCAALFRQQKQVHIDTSALTLSTSAAI